MNQIGPTLPPIGAAPAAPGSPETASTLAPEGDASFAALLQQLNEEPVEVSEPAVVIASETEPAKPDNASDAADALLSAGLLAMFGLPVAAPLPAPVQTQALEDAEAESPPEIGSKKIPVTSPEISSSAFSQPADISPVTPLPTARLSSAPISPAPQKPKPAAIREIAAAPLPLPESAAPALNVATVRGIIPPVQSAVAIPVEASTPTPVAAFPVEGVDHIDPAIPATTPETVPATFTAKAEQPIILENKTPAPPEASAPNATTATVQISREVAPIASAEIFSGMVAAKLGRAMSAPTLPRSPSPNAANPAEVSARGEASLAASPSPRHAPVLATENERERSANEPPGNAETPLVPAPDFLQATFPGEPMRTDATHRSTERIQPADVAQVVSHTLAATERLRTSGQERVEVALKLEGGQELTIQLRVANGQVTPTIRTESEPLRLALEQNWSQFSQRSGERELQITKPVFESPQTSSNLTDLNQQRDGRQRTFQEPAGSFAQPSLPRRNPAPGTPTPITPQTGVRLYA